MENIVLIRQKNIRELKLEELRKKKLQDTMRLQRVNMMMEKILL